jgi:hypothetical protein
MIRYALRCDNAHRFDSWFGSSADFDRLNDRGMISCAVCGTSVVEKDLMAPAIGAAAESPAAGTAHALAAPASPAERALTELRRRIEATSENVGRNFASEARAIHEGLSPERSIIGEATTSEARALAEDGISVARLPWSSAKTN